MELGHPTIDLFASRGNHKVKKFYSLYPNPLASGVDSFYHDWSQDIIYAFPPFSLTPRVLQKLENGKTERILIGSIFVNQNWFTTQVTLLIKEPLWLLSSDISLTFPYRRKTIPYLPKTRLMACYVCIRRCMKERVGYFERKCRSYCPVLATRDDWEMYLHIQMGTIL